jgi:hypothetical protein
MATPAGWREYTHTDNKTWYISDGPNKHEFIPPSPGSAQVSPEALALVLALWPAEDPLTVIQGLDYPTLVPSPALAALLEDHNNFALHFKLKLTGRKRSRDEIVVHHSWHWAFRRLARSASKIVLHQLADSTVDHIHMSGEETRMAFLGRAATPYPPWEVARDMGHEETLILGDLGEHSLVYPVDTADVIQLRNALRRDRLGAHH